MAFVTDIPASTIRAISKQAPRNLAREYKKRVPKRDTIVSWYFSGHATDFLYANYQRKKCREVTFSQKDGKPCTDLNEVTSYLKDVSSSLDWE
ncbi:hypothetical protein TNCV_1176061 [Trichonephila clavipes]|nr:hypothetical protein TNCV_1176061 [Trichonephila clavipes]